MSSDPSSGEPKKLTTQDILARARAQAAAKAAGGAPSADVAAPEAAAPTPAPEPPAAAAPAPLPKPAGAAPKSTADILAAARAQAAAKAAGGAPAPAPASAAAPAAKPKSTADILAAARASAGGAGGAAAKAAPAAGGAAPAAAAPANVSLQEMLATVRGEKGAVAAPVAPAPEKKPLAAPPLPPKPAPAAAKKKEAVDRRTVLEVLLSPFVLAWTMFTAASVAATLASLRFMMPNVLTEPPSRFKVGPPSDYDLGTVSEKWKAQYGIWIVHTDRYQGRNLVYALSTVCTHLGCTPSWLDGEQKFKCPCHGSGFYINGINFEGPAPRPLERVGIRLASDGQLEVDKSLKFQEEMGQWNDPASYVDMSVA